MSVLEARFVLRRSAFELQVDLQLPGRGITALFGPSGSGKTTLLRCIAGLERAPQGRLLIDGEVWQDATRFVPTHRRPLAYVFQEASLFEHLNVWDNLRYGQRRAGSARSGLDQAIDLLGIGALLQRRPDSLSGGERQRVAIARALAVQPRLLLMDEPLAALDQQRKLEILPYLERLHEQLEVPVLYVSHAVDEVIRLADHLVLLDQGRVQTSGPLQSTLARLDLPGRPGAEPMTVHSGVIGAIDERWQLARVDLQGASLWTMDRGLPLGAAVRVRLLARDISLASVTPTGSSIQNVLHGVVDALGEDVHPALTLVRMRVGECLLLARLTRRAAHDLDVRPGRELLVQVKSVALLEP